MDQFKYYFYYCAIVALPINAHIDDNHPHFSTIFQIDSKRNTNRPISNPTTRKLFKKRISNKK